MAGIHPKTMLAAVAMIVALAAAVLLAIGTRPPAVELRAYTDEGSGLGAGSVVRLNGITIGDLDRLELTNERDPNRKVLFLMKIRPQFLRQIPDDSVVAVSSTNLLGGDFINIIRGRSGRPVQAGGELQTMKAMDPQKLMAEMGNELVDVQNIFARADKLLGDVGAGHGNIGRFTTERLPALDRASAELKRLTADISAGRGTAGKLGELAGPMQSMQDRLNRLSADYPGGTMGQLPALAEEIEEMNVEFSKLSAEMGAKQGAGTRFAALQERYGELLTRFQAIAGRLDSGQGTLGQFTVNGQFSAAVANAGAEFQALAAGIKANPRKFIRFRIF